jgi:hypothetical protein
MTKRLHEAIGVQFCRVPILPVIRFFLALIAD